jgi:hypothetical protein
MTQETGIVTTQNAFSETCQLQLSDAFARSLRTELVV